MQGPLLPLRRSHRVDAGMQHAPVSNAPPGNAHHTTRGSARGEALLVLLVALLVGLAFQGSRHLWDPDEGRYTDVAREMVELEDWLVPRLDPERPHFTKPPLTYWAIGASTRLLGDTVWAMRLPNALAFAATALLVLLLARRLGLAFPAFTALAWATAWGPAAAANVVTTDTLLTAFETLAVYGFVASGLVNGNDRPHGSGLRLMWLGLGLAFLTKGPPALLPLLAIMSFVAWRRRAHLWRLFDPAGLAIFAVVGLGWYALLVTRAPDLLNYFLVHETLGRVATGEHHRNPGWVGWLVVYGPALLLGSFPWLVPGLVLRRKGRSQAVGLPDPDVRRFLALWFGLPFAVLALAQSRLPLYVLPLLVPLMLGLTAPLGSWARHGGRAAASVGAAVLVVIALKYAAAQLHPSGDAHALASELREAVDLGTVDEIVFVDVPARYGLKHYLGMTVEQLESFAGSIGPPGYSPPEPLCQELATPERLLIIAPARRLGPIEAELGKCPHPLERLGTLRQWALFRSGPGASSGG